MTIHPVWKPLADGTQAAFFRGMNKIATDPKILALKQAIARVANVAEALSPVTLMLCHEQRTYGFVSHPRKCLPCRFVRLWQARNRRTRVLLARNRVLLARKGAV